MTFGIIAGAAVLLLILWLGNGIRRIGAVSVGEKIPDRAGSALLLIDLQSVFWDRGPYPKSARDAAEAAILAEAEAARAKGDPIIAVRQEWSIPSTKVVAKLAMKGQALEGSEGTEIAEAFRSLPDHVLVKRVQDAFETGELDTLLKRLDIGKLRIVGLDTNYCVLKTALAASNRGYDVAVVKAASLAAAPTDSAEKQMLSAGVAVC